MAVVSPSRAVATPSAIEKLLRGLAAQQSEIMAEQARQRGTLDRILQSLERGRGARDAADTGLLLASAEALGDRSFTSAQLMAHADADPALREALMAADVTTTQELGCLLRRLEGITLRGLRLERVGADRAGVRWRVQVCEDEPRSLAAADTRES